MLISDVYDDFALPGIDRSKWTYSGNVSINDAINGLLMLTDVGNTDDNYIQSDPVDPNSSRFMVNLSLVTSTNSYWYMSMPEQDGTSRNWKIVLQDDSGTFKFHASYLDPYTADYVDLDLFTYTPSIHKWFAIYLSADNKMFFQFSSNGSTWTTFSSYSVSSAVASVCMRIGVQNLDTSAPGNMQATVNYVNTSTAINRGPGYLTETFNGLPPISMSVFAEYGTVYVNALDDGASIATETDTNPNKVLKLESSSTTTQVVMRTSQDQKIKNFSMQFKMLIADVGAGVSSIQWRINGSNLDRYQLNVNGTTMTLVRYADGSVADTIGTITATTTESLWYTYKIINVNNTIVIFRDDGSTGIPVELDRFEDSANIQLGYIGFSTAVSVTWFDQLSISSVNSVPVVPAEITPPRLIPDNGYQTGRSLGYNPQIYDRDPTKYTHFGHYEYIYLSEDGYYDLNIEPSLGSINYTSLDLGSASVREFTVPRSYQDGNDDFTQFIGPKAVTLSGVIVPDKRLIGTTGLEGGIDYEAGNVQAQLSMLLAWTHPKRRPQLIYKLKGRPEIRLDLRASTFTRDNNMDDRDTQDFDISWVVPDGKGYAYTQRKDNVEPNDNQAAIVYTYGDRSTEPIFRFYGPCTNPKITNTTLTDLGQLAALGITGTISSGSFIEVNVKTRTVRLNGLQDSSANKDKMLTTRNWFNLEPFANGLKLTNSDGGAGIVVVYHKDAHA